jgi:argininosuccinate lyase
VASISSEPTGRFRGRLKKGVHPTVVASITEPYLAAGLALVEHHYYVHEAHVLMLHERGLLDAASCGTLLRGLSRLKSGALTAVPLDIETDLYMNTESRLIALVGQVGGMMHIGRSRNDVYATVGRMNVRGQLLDTLDGACALIDSALGVAQAQRSTTMPGYTHWQQAQPVTVGHYLTGITQSVLRDAERLQAAYRHTDACAMGAAALSGTSFGIDRERVAQLLGFASVVENTYDAVAGRDYVAESAAALAILMVTLSRLAEDLSIWSTQEFGVVDMPDEFAITSSIMPQKKNPFVLEHIKGRAGHAIAAATGVLTVLKGTSFSHSREVGGESVAGVSSAFAQCRGALAMMAEMLPAIRFDAVLMERRAAEGFCTVTDLVDLIVRERHTPFRVAHQIVAHLVNSVQETGRTVRDIDSDAVDDAARAVGGSALGLSPSSVRDALDPRRNVEAREIVGGPGPRALDRMIARQRSMLDDHRRWLATQRATLSDARAACSRACDALRDAVAANTAP